MRAADFCFPQLLSTTCTRVSSVLDARRSRKGSARAEEWECFTALSSLRRVAFLFLRRFVGRSLPRARRATVPLAPLSPLALCSLLSSRVTSRTIETASAWTPSEGLPSSAVRSAFHRQGSAPSFRTPFRAPDLDAILFTTRDFERSRTASRLRFARASPWLAPFGARSARRALGPVCPDLFRFRKMRSNASLDRRRRPTTSATRHDPRARPSSCRSSPVPYKRTAVLPVACATLARGGPRPHVNHRRMVPASLARLSPNPREREPGSPVKNEPSARRWPWAETHASRRTNGSRAASEGLAVFGQCPSSLPLPGTRVADAAPTKGAGGSLCRARRRPRPLSAAASRKATVSKRSRCLPPLRNPIQTRRLSAFALGPCRADTKRIAPASRPLGTSLLSRRPSRCREFDGHCSRRSRLFHRSRGASP